MVYDAVIVGGGPAGLAAALTLGRARKRVLVCDSGPRRNAAAERIHNFVTRDGTPPDEFRRLGREQLLAYPNVEVRDLRVDAITGEKGAFRVVLGAEAVEAKRVILCTGMVDELLPIDGFRELWGHSIFQCPYCHGWEVQDRAWGVLASAEHAGMLMPFALQLRGWTRDVAVFTGGLFEFSADVQAGLLTGGVRVETAPISRLVGRDGRLASVEFSDGRQVPRDVLFAHPPQRQVALIQALGIALDEQGFVRTDPMTRETSVPGIYAAGDLTSRMQAAIVGAAGGMQAAAMLNLELTMSMASSGAL